MARVIITDTLLNNLADAISEKTGEPLPLTISEMTGAVEDIVSPSGSINISTNGTHDVAAYEQAIVSVSGGSVNLQSKTKTYTPTESQQTESITYDSGYQGLDTVNVTVNAVSADYVGSNITRRTSSDLSSRSGVVTVPAGYYDQEYTKAVTTGSAGTPTATKGTVSNNSVEITPSVTNTTGYITGGTKTGTAVTVSASELVSGSQTITTNGTTDVTNIASVTVAVPIVTYYTGTTTPAASLGSNGDIYLKTT